MELLDKTAAANMRARREALGLPRFEIARRAECSPAFLQIVEAGALPRRSQVVPRILAVLDALEAQSAKAE